MAIRRHGRELTPAQQKSYVMKLAGWSSEEYRKNYESLRKRARNYEKIAGFPRGALNVADLLARDVRARKLKPLYGETYKPTETLAAVLVTPSSNKISRAGRDRALQAGYDSIVRQYRNQLEIPVVAEAYSEGVLAGKSPAAIRADVENALHIAGQKEKEFNLLRQQKLREGDFSWLSKKFDYFSI